MNPANIEAELRIYTKLLDLHIQYLSWQLEGSEGYNPKDIERKCLHKHPDKPEECKILTQCVQNVCTGKKGVDTKNLTPYEKKYALRFREGIQKSVEDMIELQNEEGNPQLSPNFVQECILDEFNPITLAKFIPALKQSQKLLDLMTESHKKAKKKPRIPREYLTSILSQCMIAHPNKVETNKEIAHSLSLLFCGDKQKEFINAATRCITLHGKDGKKVAIPNHKQLSFLCRHFKKTETQK